MKVPRKDGGYVVVTRLQSQCKTCRGAAPAEGGAARVTWQKERDAVAARKATRADAVAARKATRADAGKPE